MPLLVVDRSFLSSAVGIHSEHNAELFAFVLQSRLSVGLFAHTTNVIVVAGNRRPAFMPKEYAF